jgi:hypothetical protein
VAQISRRTFLAGAGGLGLLGLLDACTSHHTSSPNLIGSDGDIVALLRRAVQASPDFLQRRAADAVASKDADTIVTFVRDAISVVPSWNHSDDPVTASRWGARATLRGGSGSLRDRAELLVSLLTAAGFSAVVKSANRPAAIGLTELYQVRSAAFAPDAKLLDQALKLLPKGTLTSAPDPKPHSVIDAPAAAAAKAITAALPLAVQRAQLRTDLLPANVPVVAITSGSSTRYAYALGSLPIVTTAPSGLAQAYEAVRAPQVNISVSGLTNPAPGSTTPSGSVIEIVSGEWPGEDVFGRQVLLNFVPPGGGAAMLTSQPQEQPIRVPVLQLQAELPAYQAAEVAKLAPSPSPSPTAVASSLVPVSGSMITLQGDILPSSENPTSTTLTGPYGPIASLSPADRASAMSRAASLTVVANGTRFTDIELDVAVVDSSGAIVPGLDASAFTVTEDGKAVSAAVISNAVGSNRPRVLVVYDNSGSVTEEWPSTAAKNQFDQKLAATLVAAAAETPFDVQVRGLGTNPDPAQWAAPAAAAMLTGMNNADDFSTLWAELSGTAIDQGVVAMIVVSDFVALDDPTTIAYAQRRLAGAAIPVFCLPIGKPDAPTIAKIIQLSGGLQLDPSATGTADALAAAIKPLVDRRTQSAYRLRYTAPTAGAATRTVRVALTGGSKPTATGSYRVPATPGTPASFAGLYLTISIGDIYVTQRHLAGLQLYHGNAVGDLDDPAATEETRAAILGLTTIGIEPGSVTAAALTDDVLSSWQSLEPVFTLPAGATTQTVLKTATAKGIRRVPALFAALLQQVATGADAAAIPAVRVAVLRERAQTDGTPISLDLPPEANTIVPIGPDPSAAFAAGLRISTRMGAVESAVSVGSAFSQLAGQPLTFLRDSHAIDAYVARMPAAARDAWTAVLTEFSDMLLLVPAPIPAGGSGTVSAFWVLDPVSGAATPMLLDSSGGAPVPCGSDYFNTMLLLNALVTVGAVVCQFAGQGLIWFCLGITAANLFLVAASLLQAGTGASIVPGVVTAGVGRTFVFAGGAAGMNDLSLPGAILNSILLIWAFIYGNPPPDDCP